MKTMFKITALILLALVGSPAHADKDAIKKALNKAIPEMKIDSVTESEIKGLYEVIVGTTLYYASEDGKYLLQGHLIDVATRTDLTEEKLNGARKEALAKMGTDKMIVFQPKIHKYTVTVFTDIDCGYCRKLHSEMDQYLAEGITVQYMFFPRAGKGSESYKKAISVWCAKDRNAALTTAKRDQPIEAKTCDNPIDAHMQLAEDFGVSGTPMIVAENGRIFPGYLPAKKLVEALNSEKMIK